MGEWSASNPLGTDISTAEIQTGAVTADKLDSTSLGKWELLDTATAAGGSDTLTTSGTITGYTRYCVIWEHADTAAACGYIHLRFNADSTAGAYSYAGAFLNSSPAYWSSTSATYGQCGRTNTGHGGGMLFIQGATGDPKTWQSTSGADDEAMIVAGGEWHLGTNVAISSISLISQSSTWNAGFKIYVYGIN